MTTEKQPPGKIANDATNTPRVRSTNGLTRIRHGKPIDIHFVGRYTQDEPVSSPGFKRQAPFTLVRYISDVIVS